MASTFLPLTAALLLPAAAAAVGCAEKLVFAYFGSEQQYESLYMAYSDGADGANWSDVNGMFSIAPLF